MVEDCIGRGKSLQEGGAIYNFTGPQGFGIANMADALSAVKKLVFEEKSVTMQEYKEALENNYGRDMDPNQAERLTSQVARRMVENGKTLAADDDYSLFPPCITCLVNREVIGIVTKIDKADPHRAEGWLRLSGCKDVFFVNSHTGEGTNNIILHLKQHKTNQKTEK